MSCLSVVLRGVSVALFVVAALCFVLAFQLNSFGDLDAVATTTITTATGAEVDFTTSTHRRREYTRSRALLLTSTMVLVLAIGVAVVHLHMDGLMHRMELVAALMPCVRELAYERRTRPPRPFVVGDADSTVLMSTSTRYNEVCGYAQRSARQWMQYDFSETPVSDDRHGAVYLSKENKLVAIEAATGTSLWVFENVDENGYPSFADLSDPVVGVGEDDGTIYVASLDNRLHAIHKRDGTLAWTQAPSKEAYSRVFLVHEQRVHPGAPEVSFVILTLLGLLVALALVPEFFLKSITVYSGDCPDSYDACYLNDGVPVFETDFDALPFNCSRALESGERLHCFTYVGFSFGLLATAMGIVYSFILLQMQLTSLILRLTTRTWAKFRWAVGCFVLAAIILLAVGVALTQRFIESFSTSDLIQAMGFSMQTTALGVILLQLQRHDALNRRMQPFRPPYTSVVHQEARNGNGSAGLGAGEPYLDDDAMAFKGLPADVETTC